MRDASKTEKIPFQIIIYLNLIKKKKSPYYDVACHIVKEMEKTQKRHQELYDMFYVINAKKLEREISKKLSDEKLTRTNVSRTLLAVLHGSKLKKGDEYYITIRRGGGKNYHIKLNRKVLAKLGAVI